MIIEDRYPTGTCTGTDFVYGGQLALGERVVNLQRDAYEFPMAGGLLCLSESTVAKIVHLLGWPSVDERDDLLINLNTARADAALLRERLAELEADREEAVAALRAINRHSTPKAGARAGTS